MAAGWLGAMLRRPPLSRPADSGFAYLAAVVEALWWDIHDLTPDPLSPAVEGLGMVPQTHPRLIPSHPWGDDPG
jgi:hypothetical protein